MGAALAALPAGTARVVAFGQATAAVLPEGLDVFVYPIREGTILPAPFLNSLVQHEKPQALLAPAGSVTAPPIPTLVLDLDPRVPPDQIAGTDEPGQQGWIEAVTYLPDRRNALIRAGLFSVDLSPEWFEGPARLSAAAAPLLKQRLEDLAGLTSLEKPHLADAAEAFPLPPLETPTKKPEAGEKDFTLASPIKTLELPAPPVPVVPEGEVHSPDRYRDREAGGRVVVLAAMHGLDALTPADLAHSAVISVPETLAWLSSRMGVSKFICAASTPPTLEIADALRTSRAVFVHAEHLDGEALAPRCRARVPVLDLQRAGGPALGWSDEMTKGFFPGPGDVALALQWAHWLGAAEIVLAGLDPGEGRPLWAAFFSGAKQLLESRGITLLLAQSTPQEDRTLEITTAPVPGFLAS